MRQAVLTLLLALAVFQAQLPVVASASRMIQNMAVSSLCAEDGQQHAPNDHTHKKLLPACSICLFVQAFSGITPVPSMLLVLGVVTFFLYRHLPKALQLLALKGFGQFSPRSPPFAFYSFV